MEKRREEAYKKLLMKRGLERHKEAIEHARKKISYKEKEKELYEELKAISQIVGKSGLTEEEKDKLELLEEEIRKLEEEIRKDLSPEEIEELKRQSFKRLAKFMRDRYELLKTRDEYYTDLRELEKEYEKAILSSEKKRYLDLITKYEKDIKEIEELLQQLKFQNPESYLADCLLTLQEYVEQLPSGIVETDYPKTMKEEIKKELLENRLVTLVGETGTGKTEIARKVAKELTGDYKYIIPPHFLLK